MPEPQCVRHPDEQFPDRRAVKAGSYAVGEHPRQMFWCYPNGKRDDPAKHRYAGVLARKLLDPATRFCGDCATHLAAHEGPAHSHGYDFDTRTISAALVAVGHGASYNRAAKVARASTGRFRTSTQRAPMFGANGTLVADWVGLFGPVVTRPVTEGREWPSIVALDELPFQGSHKRRKAAEELGRPGSVGWSVLAAYAYPEGHPDAAVLGRAPQLQGRERKAGYLFALWPIAHAVNATNAADALRSIPGRPRYVITDGGTALPAAVRRAWPRAIDPTTGEITAEEPVIVPSTWHLGRDLRRWLALTRVAEVANPAAATPPPAPSPLHVGLVNKPRGYATRGWSVPPRPGLPVVGEDHELTELVTYALRSVAEWDAFYAAAQRWDAAELLVRLGTGADVRYALANWPAGVARSTGGLEGALEQIKHSIKDRAAVLANVERTQQLLNLLLMVSRGLADERVYNAAIHAALAARDGLAPKQNVGITGGPRLQGVPAQRNPAQMTKAATRTRYPKRKRTRPAPQPIPGFTLPSPALPASSSAPVRW